MTNRRAFLKRTGGAVGLLGATGLSGCTETSSTVGTGEPSNSTGTTVGTSSPTSNTSTPGGTYEAPAWFTDRGDLAHTANVNDSISTPLRQRWKASIHGSVKGSPVGGHGHILVGSDDGYLYALDPQDGSTDWTFPTGSSIGTTPTAVSANKGQDKYVFVTAENGNLYAIDPSSGTEHWSVSGPASSSISSPTYASGRVFYAYEDTGGSSKLRAVDVGSGSVEWEEGVQNTTTATPMYAFGNVHLGVYGSSRVLYSYDGATGNGNWAVQVHNASGGGFTSGVADSEVNQGDPTIVYLSPESGKIEGRNANTGAIEHSLPLQESGDVTGLALTQNRSRKYLVAAQREHLAMVYPPGKTYLISYSHDRNPISSNGQTAKPAIYGNHIFHVVGGDRLVSVSMEDSTEEWSATLDATSYSSPCVGGKSVYVADTAGNVYAFSP